MRPRLCITILLAGVALGCGWSSRSTEPLRRMADPQTPAVFALLINGGGSPERNYQSHWLHVKELTEVLVSRGLPEEHIIVFASDGVDPGADLAVQAPLNDERFWLVENLPVGNTLRPQIKLENSVFENLRVYPATKSALDSWFDGPAGSLRAGDTLIIYVTDHGHKNKLDLTDNSIVLWGEELSVREFGAHVRQLSPGVRVVSLMSQCFSGSFANVIYDSAGEAEPDGSVCGYFASTAERPAHGCYAENRGRHNVGFSFRFIEAMRFTPAFLEAHARVLVADQTPDVPHRTSDYYLRRLLEQAAEERDLPMDDFVDLMLETASERPEPHRDNLELLASISEAFGSLNFSSMDDLDRERATLRNLKRRFSNYERRWSSGLQDLKRENLARFFHARPEWRRRASRAAYGLKPAAQDRLRRRFLDALEKFTEADLTLWFRLQTMREWVEPVEKARYRMQVRLATVERLRSLLIRVAGQTYLEEMASPAEWAAFEQLSSCEAFSLEEASDPIPSRLERPIPYPSLDDDIELSTRAAPGWIGIGYRRSPAVPPGFTEHPQGTVLVTKVYPGSPADRAGLEVGDLLLGPPGHYFEWANEIRDWTMLSPPDEHRALDLLRGREVVTVSIQTDPFPERLLD